ncbi:hypothetical protein JKP75_00340 [Blastococcus sp. TML/M2B]|uniref:hypothetical protein n=1 Tax=unclassified Blastococcus TaxID=2619396 RepID=UPI00190B5CCF|nr:MULTISPECIES: hypothetical protein [unclassified Blastococcus]MBN1091179.1 hypothetical protein [Blastococcus sp. TML/M2B]MBN1095266.1 hypothetical protein [Blastococcus sp. TML/C7B]
MATDPPIGDPRPVGPPPSHQPPPAGAPPYAGPPQAGPPPGAWMPPPPRRTSAGRVIAAVVGALLFLPALGLLAGGGVLLWVDQRERADDGYLYTASDTFATPGHALVTETIDLDTGADWVGASAALGTARVEVTTAEPGTDVFVGIAPAADAAAYLAGVQRTVVDDLGLDTSAADQELLAGGAPSGPPADQDFWTVQATGPGTQQLSWEPDDGSWTLVVMNADGSAGVAVDARIGATLPALTGLAWGLLGGGLVLVGLAVLLLVLALRRPAVPRYAWTPPPGGPPPGWAPPAPVDRSSAADAQRGPTIGSTPRDPRSG